MLTFLLSFLLSFLMAGQAPVTGQAPAVEFSPLQKIEVMMNEYDQQVASRDTLAAMDVLDSLNGRMFLKMDGYEFTWNPQQQTVEFFKQDGSLVEDAITSIDGVGRQAFTIPVTENAVISGWVDVDMAHHRIIVAMGSDQAIIGLVTDSTTNLTIPGPIARKSCRCISSGTEIGGCGFSWCGLPPRTCRGGQNSGTCGNVIVPNDP